MGGAIVRGILERGLFAPDSVALCDVIAEKAQELARELHVRAVETAVEVAQEADIVLIAVKPQTMGDCLEGIKEAIDTSKLIISIAAGITTEFIENRVGEEIRVVRAMPNTPALVGAGATTICGGSSAKERDLDEAEKIFAALGKVYRLDEELIDAVTALSGSGPAYLFLFAESLQKAAIRAGLPESEAPDLVAQTLFGASKLLMESSDTASTLREKVTSPGGTTEAALAIFEDRGFEQSIIAAVEGALARAKELGGTTAK
jgi:pyrroline-5-carboxylate reductase